MIMTLHIITGVFHPVGHLKMVGEWIDQKVMGTIIATQRMSSIGSWNDNDKTEDSRTDQPKCGNYERYERNCLKLNSVNQLTNLVM